MTNDDLKIIRIKNIIAKLHYSKDPFLSGFLEGQMDIIIRGREYTIPVCIVYGRDLYVDVESDRFDDNLFPLEIIEKIDNFLDENSDIYYDVLPETIPFIKEIKVNRTIK